MNGNRPPQILDRVRRNRVLVAAMALALLVLIVGAPVWAATLPDGLEQGTVPVPPPGDGGNGSSGGDDRSEGNENALPEVTSTPVPAGMATPEAVVVTPSIAGALPAFHGVVNAPRLNVRSGPAATFPALGTVIANQRLQIHARNPENTWWYSCCISGTTTSGWVSAAFVDPEFGAAQAALIPVAGTAPAAAPVAPASSAGLTATVAAARLNLRSEPNINSTILGKLLLGEQVRVLKRDASGEWWNVCCVAGSSTAGWASAQFLTTARSLASANALLPQEGAIALVVLPTPTPKAPRAAVASSVPSTTTLGLALHQNPEFVLPGERLELSFVIHNTGPVTATGVELRNELAAPLSLLGSRTQLAGEVKAEGMAGAGSLLTILWPEIAAGGSVTATIDLALADVVDAGGVIDNFAAVAAGNAETSSAGISIGLPPATLPDFQ